MSFGSSSRLLAVAEAFDRMHTVTAGAFLGVLLAYQVEVVKRFLEIPPFRKELDVTRTGAMLTNDMYSRDSTTFRCIPCSGECDEATKAMLRLRKQDGTLLATHETPPSLEHELE